MTSGGGGGGGPGAEVTSTFFAGLNEPQRQPKRGASPTNDLAVLETMRGRKERREGTRKRRERRKTEGCTCKKSKCVKRYCVCYAQNKFCTPLCQCCDDCINTDTPQHRILLAKHREATVKRNGTDAFESLEVRTQITCNCVKSNCQKNYCLCYQSGIQCIASCKCVDCYNDKDEAYTAASTRQSRRGGGEGGGGEGGGGEGGAGPAGGSGAGHSHQHHQRQHHHGGGGRPEEYDEEEEEEDEGEDSENSYEYASDFEQ